MEEILDNTTINTHLQTGGCASYTMAHTKRKKFSLFPSVNLKMHKIHFHYTRIPKKEVLADI